MSHFAVSQSLVSVPASPVARTERARCPCLRWKPHGCNYLFVLSTRS
ncbi:hypothetical protein DVS28_a3306 [Euzebya pacifica]|uniref:Uncharacterized protein n=1 Tax=Euzebya pacifica TaxID=1608957 RepID=A0A346Y0I4_9ACTN|nr:hypothetical protein DVS28_a3306 [Euzebya pacifica]